MQYDGIIRIQNSINVKYKETSKATNYAEIQSRISELRKAIDPLCNMKIGEMQSVSKEISNAVKMYNMDTCRNIILNSANVASELRVILADYNHIIRKTVNVTSFEQFKKLHKKYLFLKIADEIGFPIYLEVDSELQDKLIHLYRKNGNQCNKKEMCEIILDYYNDEYIDRMIDGIKNVQVFNPHRVVLIEEGIEAYQLGLYAPSASLFATQLSGMISDVYKEMNTVYRFSKGEKQELLMEFNQNCKPDSEKGMLVQIVSYQPNGIFVWYKALQYFLNIIYSSNENMSKYPQRNMICHGKQLNYNTKEMNLKLILCMDIIAELAWRIRKMKEENLVVDVEQK